MATAISTNLKDTTQSARTLASAAVSRIPSYIPHSLQPYYHSSKDVLTTKYHKLYAEYQRSDEDTQAKVLNIIRIAGEQVPFLERITENFYEKAAHAKFPLPSDSASKDSSNPPPPPPAEKQKY
ncbi:hypothetical protein EV182_007809 [Spiromyces aspiralis]|uniref:Uncharacterized protein n=1 Tax=Spiromyces aspiralis TaxID=68401 RepID=A0ACC1HAQ0_9FUNG|nr:hypothetical protein EV182_007809 [Spiromyces aspiralis]